jgi:hypothetical protein
MLADVYGWFTEGFDTADLKNANAPLGLGEKPRADANRSWSWPTLPR